MLVYKSSLERGKPKGIARLGLGRDTAWLGIHSEVLRTPIPPLSEAVTLETLNEELGVGL